jgi:hypothetical protein
LPFHHIKLSDSEAILARHCFNVLLKTFKAWMSTLVCLMWGECLQGLSFVLQHNNKFYIDLTKASSAHN